MVENQLQSLNSVWSSLDGRRRLMVVIATLAMFAAVLFLARGAGDKDMSLLFGGLEAGAAGDVITALDQSGVPYEVRGAAIYVPTADRDSVRMSLAGNGLPANGNQGYEILDELSGFSTTSQMFDAAYWRAREGELARTIVASPHIRSARVHISVPANRPFQRDHVATAAVTVSSGAGSLSAQQVKALQYLVGSAVPGLAPEAVAIIDGDGGLLSESGDSIAATNGDERARELKQRAERLLAARVGPGNALVEVSIDTVTETESIIERRVDPDSRVAISTDVTETAGTSSDSRNGNVTVASNLPDGDAGGENGRSTNENSESRALTNYEVSQTERQLVRAAGAVKRLTVAVLVNEASVVGPDGNATTTARSEEELDALRDLVASAVGIDAARGDIITLKSMSFEPASVLGTEALASSARVPLDIMRLIQIGVLALVSLILGLFVVRPILTQMSSQQLIESSGDLSEADDVVPPMTMAISDDTMGDFMGGDVGMIASPDEDPVSRLRNMIADREEETIQILQDWIEDPAAKERA
ncbi:flagellar basal-body MS-ring/collar protein FliF [Yoonia sp. SS1-5]|uniref:Flagellar M-ring protein n=1 Tax=Yoonia rhodophyticola TaxID=3137370 RepID=A0AAN0MBI4_9RHOB